MPRSAADYRSQKKRGKMMETFFKPDRTEDQIRALWLKVARVIEEDPDQAEAS